VDAARYAKQLSGILDELQAFSDAAFVRLEDAMTTSTSSNLPRYRRVPPALALLSLVNVCCPAEVWRSYASPTAEQPAW
jgi:hypothetical protein